jgi:16S rRNA (cytosine1402-N4)-methyltransferase
MENKIHESVLAKEAIEALRVEKGKKYIDATVGTGGHSLEILRHGGRVLGIEIDPSMLAIAEDRLLEAGQEDFKLVNGNFINIGKIAEGNHWKPCAGILFDLGVTNLHLKDKNRGFSFENPQAPLDMRENPGLQAVVGADLLNALREDQLRGLFEVTLEPGAAKWISSRVIKAREGSPIKTVGDFLGICKGLKSGKSNLNEATLPFLALRIAVNSELANLEEVLPKAFGLLEKGGRLVVISFHSKEDALVKNFFRQSEAEGARLITFKPITPGETELESNKRARSARMRVIQKQI